MAGKSFFGIVILVCAFFSLDAAAQTRSSAEKQEAAKRLKEDVNSLVSEADAAAGKDPEKAYDVLGQALALLDEPSPLSREVRLTLMARVEKKMGDLRRQMTKSSPPRNQKSSGQKDKDGQVSPFFSSSSNFQVTPVVSGDRRFVRVGVRGTFSMVTPTGPMIPVQIPVPTFLYGPGLGTTVGRPENVFRLFFPAPRGTLIQLNSTVNVPSGGLAALGGSSSVMSARNEFGTPIGGHIRYLGRMFRSVGYGSDLSTVSIGVAARVISMEEEEQRFLEEASGR